MSLLEALNPKSQEEENDEILIIPKPVTDILKKEKSSSRFVPKNVKVNFFHQAFWYLNFFAFQMKQLTLDGMFRLKSENIPPLENDHESHQDVKHCKLFAFSCVRRMGFVSVKQLQTSKSMKVG